jgi:hypothetical protein
LALLMPAALAAAPAQLQRAPVSFRVEEVLHNPTMRTVTVALMPAEQADLYVVYGNAAVGSLRTEVQHARADTMAMFVLDGLTPDGEYSYRVFARQPGGGPFVPRASHGFRTLRSPDATFSFAVIADPHSWAMWSRKACLLIADGFDNLITTIDNVRGDPEIDFVVMGTDNVMTLCGSACKACPVDEQLVSNGNTTSVQDARLRYRKVLSTEVYGRFAADLPMLYMMGDHDGEKGWTVRPGNPCANSDADRYYSTQARMASIPNAFHSYGGDPMGAYYALRTGDLLLVVIDPQRYNTDAPLGPELWSLGERQLSWLDKTLRDSDATFKIVMSEHLLGGTNDPTKVCWKARGGLKSTANGQINGPFLGEQFLIHELLKQHGAQLFLSFHDHVVVWGEKVDESFVGEGVIYATGGQAAGTGAPSWSHLAWYQTEMDYDNDGVPEYMTGTTGTRAKGHFKVTVHGKQRVDLDYIRASLGGGPSNNKRVLGFSLLP